jgi:hypothetical protein
MDVDFKKLMDEDPEFKTFAQQAALAIMIADRRQAANIMGTMLSFYNMGMTADQVGEWFKNIQRFTPLEDKPQ